MNESKAELIICGFIDMLRISDCIEEIYGTEVVDIDTLYQHLVELLMNLEIKDK
jgi:hypothetical protein